MNTLEAAQEDLQKADRKADLYMRLKKRLERKIADNEIARTKYKDVIKLLSPKKPPARKGKRSQPRAGKPRVHKPDAVAACLAVVEAKPMISKEELKELALHKLVEEQGFDPSGAAMQINKCLLSPSFVVADDDTISLAKPRSNEPVSKAHGRMHSVVDNTTRRGFLS